MMSLLPEQQQSSSTVSPSGVTDRIAISFQDRACELPTMPETLKSQSIPISGMHRTASEVQLCEDEALADYRDYVVYSRIVNGISRQQETNHFFRQENNKCLAHIVSTRNQDPSLQSMSRHIVQGMAMDPTPMPPPLTDDYFCGEEPPEGADDLIAEDDEGIFALEL